SDWSAQAAQINADMSNNQRIAHGQINNAIGMYANGDAGGARTAVVNALSLDPGLAQKPEVQNLASQITGLPFDQAVEALTQPSKKDGKATPSGPRPLGSMLVSLFAECLLIFMLVAVPIAFASRSLLTFLDNLPTTTASEKADIAQLRT